MSTVVFKSNQEKLVSNIDNDVDKLLAKNPFALPGPDDSLVARCVERIQGSYDAINAKRETDNAIDLLYIAYNTTPQMRGEIRVKINKIMNSLIHAQQDSMRVMQRAVNAAVDINHELDDTLPDWLDIRQPVATGEGTHEQIQGLRDYVSTDLMRVARKIEGMATEVQKDLLRLSDTYDRIIESAEEATDSSETALGANIKEREALQREIAQNNAQRAKLESLVEELGREVKKFEDKAREFEKVASTAEERSFVLSIIGAAASIVAAIVPPVALLASSGIVGSAARGNGANAKAQDKPENEAQAKTELANKQAEHDKVKADVDELEMDIQDLDAKRTPGDDEDTKKVFDKRIDERQKELDVKKHKLAQINEAIAKLQEGIEKAKKEFDQLSDKHRDQAASLREMQIQMLDKAEKYETERRNQSAELVRIKVLLQGQHTQDETLQLAVKSLELSIASLKRMQEIIKEMAFFFKSFADFMREISASANRQLSKFENAGTSKLRVNALRDLVRSTDIFLIKQAADWHAGNKVASLFTAGFNDGWSRLNKLSGTYLTGKPLEEYLAQAGDRLEAIAKEREERAKARIYDLQNYRDGLKRDAS